MKKLVALVLSLILIAACTACSSSTNSTKSVSSQDEKTNTAKGTADQSSADKQQDGVRTAGDEKDYEAMVAVLKDLVDLEHYDCKKAGYGYAYSIKEKWEPEYVAKDDVDLIKSRKLNQEKLPVGMTMHQLMEQGWKFKDPADANKPLPGQKYGPKAVLVNGKQSITVELGNSGDQTVSYKDAALHSIRFKFYTFDRENHDLAKVENAVSIDLNDVISEKSSLKDVIDALGEPNSMTIHAGTNKESTIRVLYSDWKIGGLNFLFSGDGSTLIEGFYLFS